MKRNRTFEIAFQSLVQKKRVGIRKEPKTVPKQVKKHMLPVVNRFTCLVNRFTSLNFQKKAHASVVNRFPWVVNRFTTVKNQKISILKRKFLIKPFYKHLMILDSIVHENSIKSWANGTNWITRSSLKDHITKINKKLHHERCRSHLPKDGSRTLSAIFKNSAPRINHQDFELQN